MDWWWVLCAVLKWQLSERRERQCFKKGIGHWFEEDVADWDWIKRGNEPAYREQGTVI